MFSCLFNEDDLKKFKLVNGKEIFAEGENGYLVKIFNKKENKLYLLKQVKLDENSTDEDKLLDEFSLIREYVVSQIGIEKNVNLPKVYFLPFDVRNNLKVKENGCAIIVEFIDGNTVDFLMEEGKEELDGFRIGQIVRSLRSEDSYYRSDPKGLLEKEGLDKRVVESMSLDGELARICSLDTFFSNCDRFNENIIVDNNNVFYGIDQASAFEVILAKISLEGLSQLNNSGYFKNCDKKIFDSLKIYNDTLRCLIKNISAEEIIKKLNELVLFFNYSDQQKEKFKEDIIKNCYAKNIRENIEYCKKLVQFIDTQILTKE